MRGEEKCKEIQKFRDGSNADYQKNCAKRDGGERKEEK